MSQTEALPSVKDSDQELKKALESLLFITDHPLGIERLGRLTGIRDKERIGTLISDLQRELEERDSAIQLLEVAEGFQMSTRTAYAAFVRKLFAERMTMRLSTASLETLSIVAYKQPLTRAEIEQIRGVEVIASLETLLERRLIRVVGRKESVGRPLMYGTTPDFLRHFGLKSLEALPPLAEFKEPEKIELPEILQAAEASETPEASDTPEAPEQPETPEQSETPETPEVRKEESPES